MADGTAQIELDIVGKFAKVESDIQSLETKLGSLTKKATQTKGAFSSFGTGIKNAFKQFGPAAVGMGAATLALGGLSKGIQGVLEKEDALADFSAITGVTGEKLQEFGNVATDLSNKFGTSVVGNIESFKAVLSRLGPDMAKDSDAIASMGDSINTLAKASGLDATQSMDALTTSMLQFGVDTSKPTDAATAMADQMNVMAAAAKWGAAEVPSLTEAITQVGSTSHSLNISFEETTSLLEALAKGGKYGSEAGVGLRNVLTSLVRPSRLAGAAFAEMGVSQKDIAESLASGGPHSANDALKKFADHLKKVPSLAEQAAIKAKIFGKENLAAATAILDATSATNEFTDKITGTADAYEQAAIKMGTKSEILHRKATQAFNGIVDGLEMTWGSVVEAFGGIVQTVNQTTDAFSALMSLDIAGFWNIATQSASDYNDQEERRIKLEDEAYRKEVERLGKEADYHKKRQDMFTLEAELVKKLRDVEGMTDPKKIGAIVTEFERLYKAGRVTNLDEFFLRNVNTRAGTVALTIADLKNKIKELNKEQEDASTHSGWQKIQNEIDGYKKKIEAITGKDAGGATPGTIAYLKKQQQDIANDMQNKFLPGSDAYLVAAGRLKAITDEMDRLQRIEEFLSSGPGKFDIEKSLGLKDKKISLPGVGMPGISKEATLQVDASVSVFDKLSASLDKAGGASTMFGNAFSAGIGLMMDKTADASQKSKGLMKALVGPMITGAEALLFTGTAESFAKAIGTFGISLITDTPWLAAGFAALETARAVINSLAVGTAYLPQDQIIQAHRGEMVVPESFNRALQRGQITLSGGKQIDWFASARRPVQRIVLTDSTGSRTMQKYGYQKAIA